MTWFVERRMEWIAEALHVYGYINRVHLQRKFGVSIPQASADFREFQKRHPNAMTFDRHRKCYVTAERADG